MKLTPKMTVTAGILWVVLLTNCQQGPQALNNRTVALQIVGPSEEEKATHKSQKLEYASLSSSQKQQIIRTVLDSFDWGNITKEHIYYWELWSDILYPALVKKCPWILTYQEGTFDSSIANMLITEYLPDHLKDKQAWDCLFHIMCSSDGDCAWIGDEVTKALYAQVLKTPNIKIIYEEEMQKRDDFVRSLYNLK